MRLPELRARLQELKAGGFVPSERSGPTGIGHTLEKLLGLDENNLPIPDIGGRVEVKATRTNWNNLITLFTFNKSVWQYKQADIISRWGYVDNEGRRSLYNSVSTQEANAQGLQLSVSDDAGRLLLTHMPSATLLGSWDMYHMVGKFMVKFERVLLVHADTQQVGSKEMFHFNRAEILSGPSAMTFKQGFNEGKVIIDVRMHINPKGAVRNHGTGFRIMENDMPSLFGKINRLV